MDNGPSLSLLFLTIVSAESLEVHLESVPEKNHREHISCFPCFSTFKHFDVLNERKSYVSDIVVEIDEQG